MITMHLAEPWPHLLVQFVPPLLIAGQREVPRKAANTVYQEGQHAHPEPSSGANPLPLDCCISRVSPIAVRLEGASSLGRSRGGT